MEGGDASNFVVTSGSSSLPHRSFIQYSGLVAVSLVPAISSQKEHSPVPSTPHPDSKTTTKIML